MAALVQDPGELQGGRIRGDGQAGPVAEAVHPAGLITGQARAGVGGPGVLPHDGVVDRAPAATIPDDGRLALIADPHRHEVLRRDPGLADGDLHAGPDALDDLVRVVLHPARSWRDLGVLELVAGDRLPVVIEQDAAAARGSLVDGGDEGHARMVPRTGGP